MSASRRAVASAILSLLTTAAAWPAAAVQAPDEPMRMQRPGSGSGWLPPGVTLHRDVAYGPHGAQRMDVYTPSEARRAPVLFLVHGGGWRRGDKAHAPVVRHKVEHWAAQGFVVISINYRMLPEADPLQQARDVARALAAAQRRAEAWGADADRFVLMGHSAGAHLVALLAADPALARREGARDWLGTISLDSGGLDIVETMEGRHLRLHDQAFGEDRSFWAAASPAHRLQAAQTVSRPMLLVCSSQRRQPCPQAHDHARRVRELGGQALVIEQALSHGEINEQLGLPGRYTEQVDRFIDALVRR